MRTPSILAAALSIWLAAASAWGATIATSILRQASGDQIECRVVNVGRSAMQMTSEGVNPNGSVFGRESASVDPGKAGPTIAGACNAATGGFCAAYCRFHGPVEEEHARVDNHRVGEPSAGDRRAAGTVAARRAWPSSPSPGT